MERKCKIQILNNVIVRIDSPILQEGACFVKNDTLRFSELLKKEEIIKEICVNMQFYEFVGDFCKIVLVGFKEADKLYDYCFDFAWFLIGSCEQPVSASFVRIFADLLITDPFVIIERHYLESNNQIAFCSMTFARHKENKQNK